MNILGLDFGTSLIKAVELKSDKSKSELISIAKASSKDIKLMSSSKEDMERSINFLTDFVMQNNFLGKSVNISVPQTLIYTTILKFPSLKDKELENAIKLQMEGLSPIPLEEASQTYQILPKYNEVEGTSVLVVVAPKSLTKKILDIATESGLRVNALEPEALAVSRSLLSEDSEEPTTLIVDIGHKSTNISIYSDFSIRFIRTLSTGFSAFVKSASQELSLESVQAEEYVKTYGFLSDKLEGKLKNATMPILSIILDEVKRAIAYYEKENPNSLVRRIILTGGGALVPGIIVNAANFLSVEVQIANPWNTITSLGKYKDRMSELESFAPLYSVALGLALKK